MTTTLGSPTHHLGSGDLSVTVSHLDGRCLVTVVGDVTPATGATLHLALREVLTGLGGTATRLLELDLTDAAVFAAGEVRSLIATYLRALALGVRLVVLGASQHLRARLVADGMEEMLSPVR